MASFLIQGSRFYLPRPYHGPAELLFTQLYGGNLLIDASQISCFELYKFPGVLNVNVVLHLQNGVSHVLANPEEEVKRAIAARDRRDELSL